MISKEYQMEGSCIILSHTLYRIPILLSAAHSHSLPPHLLFSHSEGEMEFACLNSKAEGPVKAGNVCGEKQMSRPEIALLSLLLCLTAFGS